MRGAAITLALLLGCSSADDPPQLPVGSGGGGPGGHSAVDECGEGLAACDPNASCVDTAGYYQCVCNEGFSGDGFSCDDIDECAVGLDDCSDNATCEAQPDGSYGCTCNPGFVGDGVDCSADYLTVVASSTHSCGVLSDGSLWCWGENSSGRLGLGSTATGYYARPFRAGNSNLWTAELASDQGHSCGVQSDGSLWCWGQNNYGAVGNGTTQHAGSPVTVDVGYRSVATGRYHSCAIKNDETAHCWGGNRHGQASPP